MKLFIISLLIISFVPLTAEGRVITIENPLEADNFVELIYNLIDFIFTLAIYISPIMIIVAGFYFITAAGDPEKINTAKKIIFWVLIGLLIVFCAKGLVKFFKDVFGVE